MFNSMHQQILFKLRKKKYVPVKITDNNHYLVHNGAILNIIFSDSTQYTQIPDTDLRIFHAVASFSVNGFITNAEFATRSVLKIKNHENIIHDIISHITIDE